jgi:predicted RND superfamily exporter protein
MLARYARFVVARRRLVIAAALVVTASLAAWIPRLRIVSDMESAFPADDPVVRLDRRIRSEFGGRNFVVIGVAPRAGDVWQPAVLHAVQDLTFAVRELPDLIEPQLLSLASPAARWVEVSEEEGVREDYLMRSVPETPAAMAALRARVMGDPLYRGGLVTEDERMALVLADFWPNADAEAVGRDVSRLLDRFRSPAYELHATGEPVVRAAEHAYIQTAPRYLVAAIAVMMLVLLASFRTWQGMLLPLLTGVLSSTWGLGLMAATGVPLGIWNQSVPTLVVIVAAGHSAQMLKRYYEELDRTGDNHRAVAESLVRIAPVMLAAGATAALGFASMALFGLRGMADLGLSAAYGIGSAVVLELSFMPALRASLTPAAARRIPAARRGFIPLLADWLLSAPGRVTTLVLAGLALGWAGIGVTHLHAAGSTRRYLPAGHRVTRDLDAITAHFPGTVPMTILFEGPPGSATAPATLGAVDRLATRLGSEPDVARTASLADLVKQLHAVFVPGRRWALPADPALTAQLLFLGRGPAFERFVDRADTHTVLWVYLRSDAPARVARVLARAQREAAGLTLPPGTVVRVAGGQGPMMLALEREVTRGKVLNLAALLLVIYALSSLVLWSPVAGAFVVLPLVCSIAITVGIVAWAGIGFDVVSATVLAIGVGIGADYAIYFLARLREEYRESGSVEDALRRALETSGRAVLFVAVAIALGFAVFGASAYRAFQLTGLLTPAGMIASCLAALSVMPALLLVTRPAFLFGDRRDGAATHVRPPFA